MDAISGKEGPTLGEGFRQRLASGLERATEANLPYAVLACVPEQLSGEDPTPLLAAAADSLPGLVRESDVVGLLPSLVLAIGSCSRAWQALRAGTFLSGP